MLKMSLFIIWCGFSCGVIGKILWDVFKFIAYSEPFGQTQKCYVIVGTLCVGIWGLIIEYNQKKVN